MDAGRGLAAVVGGGVYDVHMTKSRQDVMVDRQAAAFDRKLVKPEPADYEDDYTFRADVRTSCCGYPVRAYSDGHLICTGCEDTAPSCSCPTCEQQRALDDDADMYADNLND